MAGITSYGCYIPYWRLKGAAIATALGSGGGRGSRSVASHDEDTTSMGVEAARNALAAAGPGAAKPAALYFATADPPYLDKTNANAIHAALLLDQSAIAVDMVGSVRSGIGALLAAADASRPTLAVLSDTRTGLPGGADEAAGGDAAAAFLFGTQGALAEIVAHASSTREFLDRWRLPGSSTSSVWEDRFGEFEYVPLAGPAITDALKQANLSVDAIDHLIVGGVHARAIGVIAKAVGAKPSAMADDLTSQIGRAGTVDTALSLVGVLDKAGANETVMLVSVADGVDVIILRTTSALAAFRDQRAQRSVPALAQQLKSGRDDLVYQLFLTWKGQLRREPPRRPDPERPSAPAAARGEDWKFGFVGSRCLKCGARHLPPNRVCVKCRSVDEMTPEPLADVRATIATYTVDRLAYSMSPPVVAVVVDFDGGGRFTCELTDCDPGAVRIGQRVEMTFRRLITAQGVHNYFWKARPVRD